MNYLLVNRPKHAERADYETLLTFFERITTR
jgi:hypothetical protein